MNHRIHQSCSLTAVALLASSLASAERHTFRVRFGLADAVPTAWDGSAAVSGGELAGLRSWRPRGADRIEGASWALASAPGVKFRYRNWEPEPPSPVPDYLNRPGIILQVDAASDARVDVATAGGNISFRLSDQPAGLRREYLEGAVTIERAAGFESLSDPAYHNGFADIVAGADGSTWVAWVGYRDWGNHVFARRHDGDKWGPIEELTGGTSDVYYVRLARDGRGGTLAVWSDQREGNFDLYGTRFDGSNWAAVERLTSAAQPDIHHALVTDAAGQVWLAWQGFRNGRSDILARFWDGESWSAENSVSLSGADDWHPAMAADSKGGLYVAWETYENNDFDIRMRRFSGGEWSPVEPVADTLRYEAYPSLACDSEDRLWVAWNESGLQWGKDTGFLLNRPATQLYQSRWIATAVYEGGRWMHPPLGFEDSLPEDLRGFNDFPKLAAGSDGRVWALFRHRHLRQRQVPHTAAAHRASWETYATAFDGHEWSVPIPIPASAGRSDAGFGVAVGPDGGPHVAWATDNRIYDDYFYEQGEIFASQLPAIRGPVFPARVVPKARDELTAFPKHANEREQVQRIRDYVIESEGKSYKIYRGDTHRHTEYSGDGNNDGAQNDTYRYSMNVAELDYLGMSEHHNSGGPNIEYINWLLQQRVDVFHVPGRFVPLYGYERGVSFPNGHRNIFFAERGNPTFPDQDGERESSSAAVGLFDYVRRYGGISIPHTSATGMGTDWRDNDPEVEPLVEIYQGDRVSAEYEGAPKAATRSDVTNQAGGFRSEGYVWNAWAKGYKIGVQASSDHLSTHISYSCTIAEDFTRAGLLEAMRLRHNYAATDNIILDYRMTADGKEYLQGDVVPGVASESELSVRILGTAPVQQVDIIRGQEFVYTAQNLPDDVQIRFVDREPGRGERYYYVRVQQSDGQMAWSSPIWVISR
ncbi:MAG: hypothetical protein OXN89_17850 [Bryobacterales bacterium]|nr:hypothetical protein [Bryobacterales bacterium]